MTPIELYTGLGQLKKLTPEIHKNLTNITDLRMFPFTIPASKTK